MTACARNIPTLVCPSNPFQQFKDTAGLTPLRRYDPATVDPSSEGRCWGLTDYFATVYTSISDGICTANPNWPRRQDELPRGWSDDRRYAAAPPTTAWPPAMTSGFLLRGSSVPISAVFDGTSNTIAVIEDSGRICPKAAPQGYAYQGTKSHYGYPGTPLDS